MKPSEAKNLQSGTVLMGRRFMGAWPRVVVDRVDVIGPRKVDVHCSDKRIYPCHELELPSPDAEASWAKERDLQERQDAFYRELEAAAVFLGVRPIPGYISFSREPPTDYTVRMDRAQIRALMARLGGGE